VVKRKENAIIVRVREVRWKARPQKRLRGEVWLSLIVVAVGMEHWY